MTDQSMREDFNAAYDAFEFRREYDKYGPSEAAFSIWQAATRQALERAAKVCESVNSHGNPMTAQDCADAIRATGAPHET